MTNRRKSLPPLDTLVFFEAVTRTGGFTAASAELYVSQAAVSKRVRQLEDWLGTELFERGTRSLNATPSGEKLAEPVAMALDYLQTSLDGIKAPKYGSVRIAANSAVSLFWLFPRLKQFAMSDVSCSVETVISDDPAALLSDQSDLAIIYADTPPSGWNGHKLMDEELAPVSSPAGIAQYRSDPSSLVLLDYDRHAPDWINWDMWAKRNPSSALLRLRRTVCRTYGQSIGRALSGEGIALASCKLLQDELASGALAVLDDARLKTGKGYFLVSRPDGAARNDTRDLFHFLSEPNKSSRHGECRL